MSNARAVLEQIDEWEIVKHWTGRAYVWEVPDRGEDNGCSSLFFDSEAAALAYVNALKAVVSAQQAAITLPEDVAAEISAAGEKAFWKKWHSEDRKT
jgi:hypothetical protein